MITPDQEQTDMSDQYTGKKIWLNNSAAISVRLSEFPANSGQYGIDVRKWLQTEKYQGFTKKGIWIPVETKTHEPIAFKVVIAFIEQLAECIEETPRQLAFAIGEQCVEQVTLDEPEEKGQ